MSAQLTDLICRFCASPLQRTFVDLGMSPVANNNVPAHKSNTSEVFYPLKVFVCEKCLLVQLPTHLKEHEIFTDEYPYFSSYSASWLAHAKAYTDMAAARLGLGKQSLVIEVASNDGYLLQYFQQKRIPTLGIEPCKSVAEAAIAKGIRTEQFFLGKDTGDTLKNKGNTAELIIANNVLAHVPDLNDFIEGMRTLLKPSGVMTIEFPHLMNLIDKNQFDTIYHEHYSYYSLHSIVTIFSAHKLRVFDVEELPTHGGSLRIYVKHETNTKQPILENVDNLIKREKMFGLDQMAVYEAFHERVLKTKRNLLRLLIDIKNLGKSIAAYGAPAKGNTLLNYCGIRQDFIDYTVEDNPHKSGFLLPGTRIPIYTPDKIRETKPNYLFILPWNIKDELMNKTAYIKEWGGRYIIPIPDPQIID